MLQFSNARLGEKLRENNFFTYCNGWIDGWVGVLPVLRIVVDGWMGGCNICFEDCYNGWMGGCNICFEDC